MPSTPGKEPTVVDVAREAGVSKAQAARALGGYGAVSDHVMEVVMAAAQRLGYRPNELAKSMNTGSTRAVGVVVGDIENPHFGVAVRGITDVLRASGYAVLLANSDEDPAKEKEAVAQFLQQRVAGLIVAQARADVYEHLAAVQESRRGLVFFDRECPHVDAPSVVVDFHEVSEKVGKLLLDAGHRTIGYVSSLDLGGPYRQGLDLNSSAVAQRIEGIADAHRARGADWDESLIQLGATTAGRIEAAVGRLIDGPKRATAIVCSDNLLGQAVLFELRNRGLRVPDDVSLVVYDDFPWTQLVDPPLTVVAQPVYEMGQEAARQLLAQLSGLPATPVKPLEARLVARESVRALV
ncbi:MAG: LacI family DNA-binding transcriptional regulator [Arthrobacter sp.]|nr:LacI family DNA-binding transcriptional regulator [Arthrobacter sp.]